MKPASIALTGTDGLPRAPQPARQPVEDEVDRLADAIADVQADASRNPEAYLRETIVPGGGE